MTHLTHLPDAMPDIEKPTLLVVCDTHHCRFIDAGHHTIAFQGGVHSKENTFTDHEGRSQSPAAMGKGGMISGNNELDQVEGNRLHEFSNVVSRHLDHLIAMQGIQEVFIAAPDKFLAELKKHLSKHTQTLIRKIIDGNFMHENMHQILIRFRPDLEEAIKKLRDQENYSSKKHLPR